MRLGAERLGEESRAAEEGAIARFDLGTLRARRWSTLSGGERARVLLAMVLAVDPPALLADEPAASLDIRHRIDVVQALVARATDRLSVVVMHDLDLTFRFFDKVIVMDAGRIVAHGRARCGVRREVRAADDDARPAPAADVICPVQRCRKGAQYVILQWLGEIRE